MIWLLLAPLDLLVNMRAFPVASTEAECESLRAALSEAQQTAVVSQAE
ncbi:hypothetical protein [Paludibacterium denitrificans]|uniref:Uncharacterized protein n=1 Tax=Paludibacterium denitrificans TaxID=2675226 RepID=A0A844GFJ1_9NEIS|nr:hypothetical protein [Paludibacterium denitrificans]MTD33667.1 hypothetical protein [Paludibacterium denitrificans]